MATGVMVSRADKETKFWLPCERPKALDAVKELKHNFGADGGYFGPGLVAEFGESDGTTFTAAEALDLSPLGIK